MTNNSYVSYFNNKILIKNPYKVLSKEDADQILIYL